MSEEKRFHSLSDSQKQALAVGSLSLAGAGAVLLSTSEPASADAVADITAGVTAINTMYQTATPIAVGVVVFAAAAMVIKRLLYA